MTNHNSGSLLIRRFADNDASEVAALWLRVFPDDPP